MFDSQEPDFKADHLRWTTLKLFPGKKIRGWKGGPPNGFKTHHVGTSKPCKDKISKGSLECNYCAGKLRLGFTGYMPFISEDGDRLVVVYGRDFHTRAKEIPFGSPILVKKANSKNGVVSVTISDWSVQPCPWLVNKKKQHDIRPWLLQLWGEEDLKKYFGMEPEDIVIVQNDDDMSPQLRNRLADIPSLSQTFKEVCEKTDLNVPVPSKNGTHKGVKK
jgi:hypothetical protein